MSLRIRILLASLLLTVIPLVAVMLVVRTNVSQRFTELDTRRVEDQINIARQDLDHQDQRLKALLDALAVSVEQDNRFRLAVAGDNPAYLVDFAPRAMSLMDLDMLLVQDHNGQVLSSGHFRGSFRTGSTEEAELPRLLQHVTTGRALVAATAPDGAFLALARTCAINLGGQQYHLTGGIKLDPSHLRRLGRDEDLSVMLLWPEGMLASAPELAERFAPGTRPEEVEYLIRRQGAIVRSVALPMINGQGHGSALLLVIHDQGFLHNLLRQVNLQLLIVLIVAVIASVLLAIYLAGRISRPLRQLASSAADLDLDRLDVDFTSSDGSEVGHLSRLLDQMTIRLRESVGRIQSAEHRATLGEVARQVNHDIRNGLTPLRNVLLHLGQVAKEQPDQLGTVFHERRGTLEDGLAYLEDLATHYRRLSPERAPEPCPLAQIIEASAAGLQALPDVKLQNNIGTALPPVLADPVSLRRIFDNLLRNAVESLPQGQGTVAVGAFLEEDTDLEEMRLVVEVSDTGAGIEPENLDLVFNDFFTTREQGTGLGLSNVRRLAADCGASVRIASEVGSGTTVTLSFPLARSV